MRPVGASKRLISVSPFLVYKAEVVELVDTYV